MSTRQRISVEKKLVQVPLWHIMNNMMLRKRKQVLIGIAMAILFFFSAVSVMHAFVPHEHPHDSFVSEFGLPVHNTAGEKYFWLLMLASLFLVVPPVAILSNFFLVATLAGPSQSPDRVPPKLFLYLFARGILHSKAY